MEEEIGCWIFVGAVLIAAVFVLGLVFGDAMNLLDTIRRWL